MKTDQQQKDLNDVLERVLKLLALVLIPFKELYFGIVKRSIPVLPCLIISVFLQLFVFLQLDHRLWKAIRIGAFYPIPGTPFWLYYFCIVFSPFYLWGVFQTGMKKRMTKRLTQIFDASGLKNNLGHFPNLVFDKPIDSVTRKLRLTRAVLPLSSFERVRDAINAGLQIFIDDIRENRVEGTIDIIYAHKPMPISFPVTKGTLENIGRTKFLIGKTRSKEIIADLDNVPHLLVAGQTGKGKSTFLRQLISTLYFNNPGARFTLVDLKGGLEFQIFQELPNVEVSDGISSAIHSISQLSEVIDKRMKLLRANKCKDILQYQRISQEKRIDVEGISKNLALYRHIIVIDEAAEMFLTGHHASSKDIQTAKKVLSTVARQGRSVGVHLVVATQRPDTKALDAQIKANLTGVVCFQMANDASSITVLGNGRATDLSPQPGRAIWKVGGEMTEVQTPFLETSELTSLSNWDEKNNKELQQDSTKAIDERSFPMGAQ